MEDQMTFLRKQNSLKREWCRKYYFRFE